MLRLTRCLAVMMFLAVLGVSGAYAQATRTWVSGVGDDANPCSRTAPCKTFAGAISKTAAKGEINVLDPGGFGAITITKSITIDGSGGSIAGVLSTGGTNGIIVNAQPTDVVILRNLDINGGGTGNNGIRFIAGGMLYVENSTIYGFALYGIDFEPTAASALSVDRTLVRENVAGGLYVKPGPSGTASVMVAGSRFDHNLFGVRAEDRSEVTVRDSTMNGNTNHGIVSKSTTTPVEINLEGCVSANNGLCGINASGAAATVRMSNTTVSNNANGICTTSTAGVLSFGNNRIAGNTANGAPTGSISQQ